jgi:predicted hydrocarbon binding protein
MAEVTREKLGSYMSIECFRYLRFGAEDTAGRALIISSGKLRGHSLKDSLNGVSSEDTAQIKQKLIELLGIDGTRLCLINDIKKTANGFDVLIDESACCAGSKSEEPVCAYTLGVFIGVFEVVTGKRMNGRETECMATGHGNCLYQLEFV